METARAAPAQKEPWPEQVASFVGFFIYLLILKTYFLPLFIIPTGSMAQGLYGEHAIHTCPNCGVEYAVGWPHSGNSIRCPNCRWSESLDNLASPLRPVAGDRIFVHGWFYDRPIAGLDGLGPARWDVVVFKVPRDGETNYIKRLIGKPGEKVELIDGDVFINDRLEPKSDDAQRALWFPYYDHDYPPPVKTDARRDYYPHWAALGEAGAWAGLDTRIVRFDGLDRPRTEIQFGTDPRNPQRPGVVQDFYAYNGPRPDQRPHTVKDVRLSATLELLERRPPVGRPGGGEGYVELSLTRAAHRFYARLNSAGSLQLLHAQGPNAEPELWGRCDVPKDQGPLRVALSHLDGVVAVEVNGRCEIQSKPEQYRIAPEDARKLSSNGDPPVLRIAAANCQAKLTHVRIERDVYYTSDVDADGGEGRTPRKFYGVQGSPIQLRENEYFMLGDNSPNSQDGRYSFAGGPQDPVGPHLKQRGDYHLGTVPGDQLVGRAFFVYWPGFMPLTPWGPNILPDLGRARWIH